MNNKSKIAVGSTLGFVFFCISKAFAQTNAAPAFPESNDLQANILSAAYHQVLNNPASLMVIAFLCVLAWLCDDLPFINSRYVAHLTVILGAAIYWLFAGPESVPKTFPYPFVVLVVNGTLCGFVAFTVHRQMVARIISFVRARTGDTTFIPKPKMTDQP
jgi:hypothetical protein